MSLTFKFLPMDLVSKRVVKEMSYFVRGRFGQRNEVVYEFKAYDIFINGKYFCYICFDSDIKEWFAYVDFDSECITSDLTKKECIENIKRIYSKL